MSPLRFCMLTTFYPPHSFGGDAIGIQRLSRGLVRRGHHVTVIHDTDAYNILRRGDEPQVPDVDADQGVEVVRLRSVAPALSTLLTQQFGHPVMNGARIRRLISDGHFDVVNFHNVSLIGGPGSFATPAQRSRFIWRMNIGSSARCTCSGAIGASAVPVANAFVVPSRIAGRPSSGERRGSWSGSSSTSMP